MTALLRFLTATLVSLGIAACLIANAQDTPRRKERASGDYRVARLVEDGTPLFMTSSEEWSCKAGRVGDTLMEASTVRIETTLSFPAHARIFLNGTELNTDAVNKVMREFRPMDIMRFDITRCPNEARAHVFVLEQFAYPGPNIPVAEFEISKTGQIARVLDVQR